VCSGDTISLTAKRCKLCGQRFTNDAAFCPFDGEPLELAPEGSNLADPLIGKVIDGRYDVLESLGEGGMGTVYRVRHRALQRPLAMKVLRRDLAREKELGSRFIQEARTAATINHPNVVQITDFGNLPDGIPYFVMEFLDGEPLSAMVRHGGPLPAARAVRILVQIAAGVGAAHRAGIVHRDLKPDNVFVSHDPNGQDVVKLLDFGVAKVAGAAKLTRTGMVFGSPHYMSPEQASGQPVDHRADIYALGVVMYELFTGHVPFEADTFMGVLTKHMFVAPEPFVAKIGHSKELGALEDITLRCLEKKPEDRYATAEDLIAEVEEVVQIGSGDQLDVRPSRIDFRSRPSRDFRLADELELPATDEVNVLRALRSKQDMRYRWAILAVGVAGLLLACAIVVLVLVVARAPEPSVASSADVEVVAVPAVVAIASPSVVVDAGPALPVDTRKDAGGDGGDGESGEAALPPKQPPKPSTKRPPIGGRPPATVATSESDPPPTPTAPPKPTTKPPSTASEILNPWAN
jgi:serine/threonine-protein kinase